MTEMVTNEVPASNAYLEKMNVFARCQLSVSLPAVFIG